MSLPATVEIRNGTPSPGTFTREEYNRRLDGVRTVMGMADIDVALFTSFHNICYYSGFLYCKFGRHYGLVVDGDKSVSISANIDAGQPWRRTYGHKNLVYTDWQQDNFFQAVKDLVPDGKTVGIEFDTVELSTLDKLKAALPGARFVDIAPISMKLRMIKSDEEISHITEMARIADIGGEAVVMAIEPGVPEYKIARHATSVMLGEIARTWPDAELMDTWTWFQSGINTDGAHNPLTTMPGSSTVSTSSRSSSPASRP